MPDMYDGDEWDDEEDDCKVLGSSKSKGSAKLDYKRARKIGSTDMLVTKKSHDSSKGRKNCETSKVALRDKACTDIARFFYDAGIAFNAANYPSFRSMIEGIGQCGLGMEPPSMHEIKVPLLKKEVEETHKQMEDHKKEWVQRGCSILFDGWHNSEIVKDSTLLFIVLDEMVEEIGEQNVVQVVMANTSNYVIAGRLLETKRPNLYWTPCAAHCVDLMLEDLGKLPKVKNALKKCMFINGYICSHVTSLNMMRRFTKQRNLCRPALTRSATSFITLIQFYKQRNNLRKMVTSQEWNESTWLKEEGRKKLSSFILQDSFWRNVVYAMKLGSPLVKVLRLVNGKKKPPMGYIYEAMDNAKEAIARSFAMKEEHYKKAFDIIDRRWDCQLHQPLHAAGYFLNPEFHYGNPNSACEQVMKGLYECIERLNRDSEVRDKIILELEIYQNASGLFGIPMAIRQRKTRSPVDWWYSYGASAPNLQNFAIKVLSLTCSALGCERYWGVFQLIHSKKRNRLDQSRLNDVVFVKFNQALKRRYTTEDTSDPILLEEVDDSNEWLIGRIENNSSDDEDGDDLTHNVVCRLSGAYDHSYGIRSSRNAMDAHVSSSRIGKGKGPLSRCAHRFMKLDNDEDDDDEIEEDIGRDEYHSLGDYENEYDDGVGDGGDGDGVE